MEYTVSGVARVLKVENKLIKEWAYKFSGYLNPKANPAKGQPRLFCVNDIRVIAYILMYWEGDASIKEIEIGLNTNEYFEVESIDNLLTQLMPFFQETSESMDETWKHGVLFNGLAQFGDIFYLANSYKAAGDRLVEVALDNDEGWDLFCPIVYNYRHATELYIKSFITKHNNSHNLRMLFNKLEVRLKKEFNLVAPDWFKNIIISFDKFDPGSTTFRYGGQIEGGEVFLDLKQLEILMGWMESAFKNIRQRQGLQG